MDPITRRLVETVRQITEAAPDAPHRNPLVHAAAEFLHKQLGPLTWQKDESGKSTTDHPWHYSNRLSMALQDPMTTDVNHIVNTAHDHIIGGHHNMGDWSYDNLPPETTINHRDVDRIHEAGEAEIGELLTNHLLGVQDSLPYKRIFKIGGTTNTKTSPELKEAAMSDTLKAGLASLIIGGGIGAAGGVATPHLANLRSTVQDKMGQVVGVENAGNIERSKQEVRSQLGLGANTPATTRAAVGAGLGGLAGLIQSWRKRNNV